MRSRTRMLVRRLTAAIQVAIWVKEAKTLPRVIEY